MDQDATLETLQRTLDHIDVLLNMMTHDARLGTTETEDSLTRSAQLVYDAAQIKVLVGTLSPPDA
jgi:uncharacterized protein YoxC